MLPSNPSSPRLPRALTVAAIAAVSLGALTTPSNGQCADWRTRGAGFHFNGAVFDSINWDPDGAGPQPAMLVVAGHFTNAGGIPVRNIAAWNGTTWSALGGGVGTESDLVYSLGVYNGELIAGGVFFTAGGQNALSIARWNGTAWSPLGSGIGGPQFPSVSALTVYNGELIAAGLFNSAGGQPANCIAAWNGSTWSPLGAGIQIVSGLGVQSLAVYNGQLFAGGTFAFAGEEPVFNIARWNGVWSNVGDIFGDMNATEVAALEVYNNELIAAGRFSDAGEVSARNIARFNGTNWRPIGAIAGESFANVEDLTVHNGELVATGFFATADGTPARNIARWDGATWRALGSGVARFSRAVSSFGGDLIAGGSFLEAGGSITKSLARWSASQWSPMPGVLLPAAGAGYAVRTIASWDGSVVLGGDYSTSDADQPFETRNLSAWNGQSMRMLGDTVFGSVLASSVAPSSNGGEDLIVGGEFQFIDGVPANRIARANSLPGSFWEPMGEGFNDDVNAITRFNGQTYATGRFTHSGGTAVDRIARWDGVAWQRVAPDALNGLNGPGNAMKAYSSGASQISLVIGGAFTSAGGVSVGNIVSFNVNRANQTTSWARLGSGFNLPVLAVEHYNGSIYAAGEFTLSGGVSVNHIARWNGTAWEPVGPGLNGTVHSMAVSNGTLVVGGDFTHAGAVAVDRLARWDGQEWTRVGGGAQGRVYALAQIGNELHVGGDFTRVRLGQLESSLWGRFSEDGVPWFAEQPPAALETDCGETASFHVAPAIGYGGLSYQWRKNGTPISAGPTGTGSTILTNGVSLHIQNVNQTDAGAYDCVLSNNCGALPSTPSILTIVGDCTPCLADFNDDGAVNSQDFFDFLTPFFAQHPSADFNDDGTVNSQDFFDFLVAFFAGCE